MGEVTHKASKHRPVSAGYGWRRMVLSALGMKVLVFGAIFAGCFWLPFDKANYAANFVYPPGTVPGLFTHFETWDAQHYLFLAEEGYHPGQVSNAFYPLFPFLIRVFQPLFFNSALLAGLFLANLFSILALFYLHSLVRENQDEKTAFFACLFLAAYPGSFYMDLPYTESLFLLLAIALFYYLQKGETTKAALLAFCLPLSRPAGILMTIPLVVDSLAGKKINRWRFDKQRLIPTAALVAGFGTYLGFMQLFAGDFAEGFKEQGMFLAHHGISQVFHPLDWFCDNFIQNSYTWLGYGTGVLDRICFLGYVAALIFSWPYLKKREWFFVMVFGLVPALSGRLSSFIRYSLVLFPLFIFAARRFRHRPAYYIAPSLVLQVVLALVHSLNDWVG